MSIVQQLFKLQSMDVELDWRRARRDEIVSAIGDDSSLRPLRAELAGLKSAVTSKKMKQIELDSLVDGFEQRINDCEAKLYGGTVKLARELRDLQADCEMIKRQKDVHENESLESLEMLDQLEHAAELVNSTLSSAERDWQDIQASITVERQALDEEITKLSGSRQIQADAIFAPDLALYERIRAAHRGKSVALVRSNTCDSCRVALSNRQAHEARTATRPVRCLSCGLILLVE